MITSKNARKQVRLNFHKGMVVLHAADAAPLACALEDLSVGGCRCLVPQSALNPKLMGTWKKLLVPGARVQAQVSVPPQLSRQAYHGTIVHAHPHGNFGLDIGISFKYITPSQGKKLYAAMIALAAERLRGGKRPLDPHELEQEAAAAKENKAAVPTSMKGLRLGEVLVRMGKLSKEKLASYEKQLSRKSEKLGKQLLRDKLITTADLSHALSLQSGLPTVNLKDREIPMELRSVFKYLQLLRMEAIPFQESRDLICVAAAKPLSPKDFTELESQCRRHVLLFIGQEDQIHDLLFRLRPKGAHKSRRHMRYKAALPVYFQFCTETGAATDETLHQGASIDISEGGFQVEGEAIPNLTAEAVELQNLYVRLAFKLDEQELHLVCAIRFVKAWMRANEHVFPWVYGFELKRIEEEDRALLRNLCIRAGIVMRRDKTLKFT